MDSYNFDIYQGSPLSLSLVVKNDDGSAVDLSGYSISGGLKFAYSDTELSATFNGAIVDAANGAITVDMSGAETAALQVTIYLYGVEASNEEGNVIRILSGCIYVYPEVII